MATPALQPSAERAAAYKQLLNAAAARGDAGASTQFFADTLNGVDMGSAYRARQRWDTRDSAVADAGTAELAALQAAYAALRAKPNRRSTRTSTNSQTNSYAPQEDPFWAQYDRLINGDVPSAPSAPSAPRAPQAPKPITYPKVPRW